MLVRVEDLTLDIDALQGTAHILRGVSMTVRRGETLGIVGESGSGKSMTLRAVLGLTPGGLADRRPDELRRPGPQHPQARGAPGHARPPRRSRLPEPDDVAEPGADHREADGRGGALPSEAVARPGARTVDRPARPGRHPERGQAPARLSAPVLRRHAPARDDRDGAHLLARSADRRRGDDGARRHDPEGHPRPAAAPPGRAAHGDDHRLARPQRRRRAHRRRHRHVRRPRRRPPTDRPALRASDPPLHERAHAGDPAARHGIAHAPPRARRQPARASSTRCCRRPRPTPATCSGGARSLRPSKTRSRSPPPR